MQTKKIIVSNSGRGFDEVLELVDETARGEKLDRKARLHLRLLAEELISMVKAITGEFDASFWIEEEAGEFRLNLTARTDVSASKKRDLLSVSSTGENIAARGIMGKIRDIIENGILNYDEIESMNINNGVNYYSYGSMGLTGGDVTSQSLYVWSLSRYRDNVKDSAEDDEETWDELEKSIMANIADEVKVGIKKDRVELIVYKRF